MVLFSLTACGKKTVTEPDDGSISLGRKVSSTALSQIGVHYKLGGTTPKSGFDCSGLIVWSFKQHGIDMPRRAVEQSKAGKSIKRTDLTPGDIVSFKIRRGYHTGIYIGNGKFVHSPRTGSAIRTDSLQDAYWSKYYIGASRYL